MKLSEQPSAVAAKVLRRTHLMPSRLWIPLELHRNVKSKLRQKPQSAHTFYDIQAASWQYASHAALLPLLAFCYHTSIDTLVWSVCYEGQHYLVETWVERGTQFYEQSVVVVRSSMV